jgi:hypothetical protein
MIDREVLARLAEESGRLLGEVGVRPEDTRWIRAHAGTIASLAGEMPRADLGDRVERALRLLLRRLRSR